MAYDEELASRVRELLAREDAITEKKMFGGLAFLLHGNMAVSASRTGGLLVRVDPAATGAALAPDGDGRTHEGRVDHRRARGSQDRARTRGVGGAERRLREDAAAEVGAA